MIILPTSQYKDVTFYTIIISNMKTTDLDLELKDQQVSLYEDELVEFTTNYYNNEMFRRALTKMFGLSIIYEDWDECYALYHWDDILTMSIHQDELIEKMFNQLKNQMNAEKESNLYF